VHRSTGVIRIIKKTERGKEEGEGGATVAKGPVQVHSLNGSGKSGKEGPQVFFRRSLIFHQPTL